MEPRQRRLEGAGPLTLTDPADPQRGSARREAQSKSFPLRARTTGGWQPIRQQPSCAAVIEEHGSIRLCVNATAIVTLSTTTQARRHQPGSTHRLSRSACRLMPATLAWLLRLVGVVVPRIVGRRVSARQPSVDSAGGFLSASERSSKLASKSPAISSMRKIRPLPRVRVCGEVGRRDSDVVCRSREADEGGAESEPSQATTLATDRAPRDGPQEPDSNPSKHEQPPPVEGGPAARPLPDRISFGADVGRFGQPTGLRSELIEGRKGQSPKGFGRFDGTERATGVGPIPYS